MSKQITFGIETRKRILAGARMLAKTVAITYGPHGRTILLDRMAGLLTTKDGVTVAREVQLENLEGVGASILREACLKVNSEVGDGTTSTAIIAAAILEEAHKLIIAGWNPIFLQQNLKQACNNAKSYLNHISLPVKDQETLERIAMIASNGDEEISKALAEAAMAVGENGTISIEDGKGLGIVLNYKEGMEIDRGAASYAFLGNDLERSMDKPLVAVIGTNLVSVDDVQSIMECASQWADHPLIIIADDISSEALKMMVLNDTNNVMKCVGIQSPGFSVQKQEYLKDIAALTGATYVDPTIMPEFRDWKEEWFGGLKKIVVQAKKTTMTAYEESDSAVQDRIKQLKTEQDTLVSEFDKDRMKERIAKLSGGLCVMEIGGVSETEMKERRARIEDALGAVRAALESGVVPGGGSSYLHASYELEGLLNEKDYVCSEEYSDVGLKILIKALRKPLAQLATNAGLNGEYITEKLLDVLRSDISGDIDDPEWLGYDTVKKTIRSFHEEPQIMDPLSVVVSVLDAAVSVAGILLTVECAINNYEN